MSAHSKHYGDKCVPNEAPNALETIEQDGYTTDGAYIRRKQAAQKELLKWTREHGFKFSQGICDDLADFIIAVNKEIQADVERLGS